MKYVYLFLLLCASSSCREKYQMLLSTNQTSFLVVDGFINTSGVTRIILSRTTGLQTQGVQFEDGAIIKIEGDNNTSFILTASDSGRYVSQDLTLDENLKYRLAIKTQDNAEYVSDFVLPVKTPVIDSITYTRFNGGVEIYANAKSDENVKYYRYEYDETWEFKSYYIQELLYDFDISSPTMETFVERFPLNVTGGFNDSIYTCWQERKLTSIILGSTNGLNENRAYASLVFYPKASWELSYLYSINVRQYGISKEGYDFYRKMKKNTESLGSIFDAQPSEITGNIRSVTNSLEKIIGHIDATRATERRAFIRNADLEDWGYDNQQRCKDTLIRYVPKAVWNELSRGKALIKGEYDPTGRILLGVYAAPISCVDCTQRGKHERPVFWPN